VNGLISYHHAKPISTAFFIYLERPTRDARKTYRRCMAAASFILTHKIDGMFMLVAKIGLR